MSGPGFRPVEQLTVALQCSGFRSANIGGGNKATGKTGTLNHLPYPQCPFFLLPHRNFLPTETGTLSTVASSTQLCRGKIATVGDSQSARPGQTQILNRRDRPRHHHRCRDIIHDTRGNDPLNPDHQSQGSPSTSSQVSGHHPRYSRDPSTLFAGPINSLFLL